MRVRINTWLHVGRGLRRRDAGMHPTPTFGFPTNTKPNALPNFRNRGRRLLLILFSLPSLLSSYLSIGKAVAKKRLVVINVGRGTCIRVTKETSPPKRSEANGSNHGAKRGSITLHTHNMSGKGDVDAVILPLQASTKTMSARNKGGGRSTKAKEMEKIHRRRRGGENAPHAASSSSSSSSLSLPDENDDSDEARDPQHDRRGGGRGRADWRRGGKDGGGVDGSHPPSVTYPRWYSGMTSSPPTPTSTSRPWMAWGGRTTLMAR